MTNLDKKLSELEALCDVATEGPWDFKIDSEGDYHLRCSEDEPLIVDKPFDCADINMSEKDFNFIAQSRTAMPNLIRALEVATEAVHILGKREYPLCEKTLLRIESILNGKDENE
jgi:hypothetical protein